MDTIETRAGAPAVAADPPAREDQLARIARILLWMIGLVLAGLAFESLADVAVLVFAAALIACVLRGASERLGHWIKVPPAAALAAILLGLVGVIAFAIWLRGPALVAEVTRLTQQLGTQVDQVQHRLDQIPWAQKYVVRARDYLAGLDKHVAGMISGVATGTLGMLGSLIVLVVSALYFAISPEIYVSGTVRLLPKPRRERGRQVMTALGHTLRWWFLGQLIDMMAIGTLTAIGLYFLDVPLWGTLALIAALFNFVPYVGALAGAVPAVLVALGHGSVPALSVAILFILVQGLEGNVIAPLIQKRTVELPPVLTILSQTVLGTLLGPLGLILATPMTAAGLVLVRLIYIEDVLHDCEEAKIDRKLN